MNFCPRCGGATGPADSFCGACGTPLTGGEYGYNESANPYDAGAPVADGGALQIVAAAATLGAGANVYSAEATTEVVKGLWNLAVMLPALAVMGRRLHDVGWSAKQMIGPIVLGFVGLILLIVGIGPENFAAEEIDAENIPSVGAMFVGLALIFPAGIWQLVLEITAGFVRGTNGANRFGGKRWNPADVRR